MNSSSNKTKLSILIGLILLVPCCFFLKSFSDYKQEKKIIDNNFIILQKLESIDISTVENIIAEKQNLRDEKGGDNSNKKSNKLYFEDSVFMGDSITEGLDFYNIVSKSSVLARKGVTLVQAQDSINIISNINPQKVFILYGMNDLKSLENSNDFKDNYIKLIQAIKQNIPSAEIYLQSITPVQATVQQSDPSFSQERLDDFVGKIVDVAREENVHYIDIRPIVKDRGDLYEPDGIHFTIAFYGLWLDYLRDQLEE